MKKQINNPNIKKWHFYFWVQKFFFLPHGIYWQREHFGAYDSIWQKIKCVGLLRYKMSQQSSKIALLAKMGRCICCGHRLLWVFCAEIEWLLCEASIFGLYSKKGFNWLSAICWDWLKHWESLGQRRHGGGQLWQDWVRNRDALAAAFAPTLDIITLLFRNCILLIVIRMCSNVSGAPRRWSRFL